MKTRSMYVKTSKAYANVPRAARLIIRFKGRSTSAETFALLLRLWTIRILCKFTETKDARQMRRKMAIAVSISIWLKG
jgi:hypothetical protein